MRAKHKIARQAEMDPESRKALQGACADALDAMIARAEAACRRGEQILALAHRGEGRTLNPRAIQIREQKLRIMEETLAMLRRERQRL